MRQLLTRTAAGIMVIGLLTGCSAKNDAPAPALLTDDKSAAAENSVAPADVAPPRVVSADAGTVIAEQEFKVPGSAKDTVTVGVQSLIVEGKTMKLQLVITPNLSSISDSAKTSIYRAFGETSIRPKLVDRENLKEYSLISDTGQHWSTYAANADTTNHEPVIWWGMYAAPEDENATFDLRVIDTMEEFVDIPVTR
ncbi:hypothetical protein CQ018_06170 [Arthrobacter sp. MYb227]|uniref:hypothetical protein n=1 Tax=Arthrobacter sp. MYb227 TaxID=1848601 RepID=UPI000CFC0A0A|nr:hypothetical protein [Arthrobacter sp. MYb227]PQZ94923.1 hypothetical protein CQ018_06170 [Arthrobacter sp. MYb227]